MCSWLDGFSGYNYISVSPDDQMRTIFRIKWGTFAYKKMSFDLVNVKSLFKEPWILLSND